jgi:hypothetical protein
MSTLAEAQERDEIMAWKESCFLNFDCIRAIDSAIYTHNYEPNHYNTAAAAADVVDQFGFGRVSMIVAANIRNSEWDGRWGDANKKWAATIPAFPDDIKLVLNSHKIVLDSFTQQLQILENETEPQEYPGRNGFYVEQLFGIEIKETIVLSPTCDGIVYAEHKTARNMPACPYSTWKIAAQIPKRLNDGEMYYRAGRYFESEEKARADFAARLSELCNSQKEGSSIYIYAADTKDEKNENETENAND